MLGEKERKENEQKPGTIPRGLLWIGRTRLRKIGRDFLAVELDGSGDEALVNPALAHLEDQGVCRDDRIGPGLAVVGGEGLVDAVECYFVVGTDGLLA